MTVTERSAAIKRAKRAMRHLEEHPGATRGQLGAARTQLNLVYTLTATLDVWDAVQCMEDTVLNVYGGIPGATPRSALISNSVHTQDTHSSGTMTSIITTGDLADDVELAFTRARPWPSSVSGPTSGPSTATATSGSSGGLANADAR